LPQPSEERQEHDYAARQVEFRRLPGVSFTEIGGGALPVRNAPDQVG
jgi:hypothetical protein